MSISTLLRFQRSAYELLGWSGARVIEVFIFVPLLELPGLGMLSVSISTLKPTGSADFLSPYSHQGMAGKVWLAKVGLDSLRGCIQKT